MKSLTQVSDLGRPLWIASVGPMRSLAGISSGRVRGRESTMRQTDIMQRSRYARCGLKGDV